MTDNGVYGLGPGSRAGLVPVDIDSVAAGVMVYNSAGLALGAISIHHVMQGNRPSRPERGINDGNPKHRFAWKRRGLYRDAKATGSVFVRKENA